MRLNWRSSIYQLKIVALLFITLTAVGVTFFRVATQPQWTFREALLQVVMLISTLGGNVKELRDPVVQWFEIFYISTILIIVLWGISLLIEATVRGELVYYWGARRMEQRIRQLSKHYVICGFGRMGQEIARQFARAKRPFVVVEHNPAQIPALEASGYLFVQGDAREDDQLQRAGIEKAAGLVAVASSDEENVYITLSARVLNPAIYIVTRSSHKSGEAKLIRAGADRVISPYVIGGQRMAQAILQPSIIEFLDTIIHGEQMELVLEEVTVDEQAPICGQTLDSEADVERQLGVHVLGIMTHDGRTLMRGLEHYVMHAGDTLILLGEPDVMLTAITRLAGKHAATKVGMPTA